MRLLRLEGRQLGHWHVPLSLELSRRVTVVLGDNEAGKSTLRRAIHALLFGPNQQLVAPLTVAAFDVTAQIECDAQLHTLHRRGRGLQGEPAPVAARLLDAGHAARFAALFCLSHDTLLPHDPQGFLRADGLLGSLMFGARTGLSPTRLHSARTAIDKALTAFESRAHRGDGFPLLRARYLDQRERREGVARFDASDDAHDRAARLNEDVTGLEAALAAIEAEEQHLQRMLDGAADLARLEQLRGQLSACQGEATPPTADQVQELKLQFQRLHDQQKAAADLHAQAAQARLAFEAAEPPGPLHALEAECVALRRLAAACAADVQALAQEEREVGRRREALLEVLDQLGVSGGEDAETAASTLLRPAPLLANLRHLLLQHERLSAEREKRAALAQVAHAELEALPASEVAVAPETDLLESVRPRLAVACQIEEALDRLRAVHDGAEQRLREGMRALELADPQAPLLSLEPPARERAAAAETSLAQARRELDVRQRAAVERAEAHKRQVERVEVQRQESPSVPSADDLGTARSLRDATVDALMCLCDGSPLGAGHVEALKRESGRLRPLVRQADLLADQRMQAGTALGQLAAAEQELRRLQIEARDAEARVADAHAAVTRAESATAGLWSCLRRVPESCDLWFKGHQACLDAWTECQNATAQLRAQQALLRDARQDIVAAAQSTLPALAAMATAHMMREAVERELQKRQAQGHRIAAAVERRDAALRKNDEAQQALNGADGALAQWRLGWLRAAADVPETVGREPVAVGEWMRLVESLRTVRDELAQARGSVEARQRAIDHGRSRIEALVRAAQALDQALVVPSGAGPAEVFAWVDSAVAQSTKRHAERERLVQEAQRAGRAWAQASESATAASERLDAQWRAAGGAGPCTEDGVAGLAKASAQVGELSAGVAQLEAAQQGRWGARAQSIAAEVATTGEATLTARLEDARQRKNSVAAALRARQDERRDAVRALEELRQQHDAVAIEQDLADAREALLEKAMSGRRLRLARFILECIHREASDGGHTVQERASEYFALLTGGAYVGVRIDDERPDAPELRAVESAHNEKTLDTLSAGTRDQLWLALRLAAIVAAAQETPFPLLLDDTLVQFDDSRTRAALRLLHNVSEHVQVILFTHHDHLADLAEAEIATEDCAVVTLPQVNGAMRQRASGSNGAGRRARPMLPDAAEPAQRPTTDGPDDRQQAKDIILQVLSGAGTPLGKDAVLNQAQQSGIDLAGCWTQAIKELLDERRVAKEGEKRGARYRLAA